MSDLDPRTLVRLMKESEHLLEDPYSGKTFRPLWLRRLSIHEEVLGRNNPAAGSGIGEIRYGYSDSPFGLCRIEVGAQGILSLNFLDSPKVLDQAAAHALVLRRGRNPARKHIRPGFQGAALPPPQGQPVSLESMAQPSDGSRVLPCFLCQARPDGR